MSMSTTMVIIVMEECRNGALGHGEFLWMVAMMTLVIVGSVLQ